jgi:hypothetical protein
VIHSIFDTDHRDWRINNTSSYMDLAPLYGGGAGPTSRSVESMRTLDGTGKLWADTFADARLLFMPPATAAVLILLNRNHNVRRCARNTRRNTHTRAVRGRHDPEHQREWDVQEPAAD